MTLQQTQQEKDLTDHDLQSMTSESCSALYSILRRHYGFIMTASWEKIYSVLGGVAKRRSSPRLFMQCACKSLRGIRRKDVKRFGNKQVYS